MIKQDGFQAAQSLLIKHSFLPESSILSGIHLQKLIIDNPSFTIQIPKQWAEEFDEQHQKLLTMSGCQEISINPLKSVSEYKTFSVMCRGTLESCRKLEHLLTPVVDNVNNLSMQQMKNRKKEIMNQMLENLFDFKMPLTRSISTPGRPNRSKKKNKRGLHHASTAPSMISQNQFSPQWPSTSSNRMNQNQWSPQLQSTPRLPGVRR